MSAESNETLETLVSNLAIDVNTIGNNAKETLLRTLKWIASLQSQWILIIDNVDVEELSCNMKELLMCLYLDVLTPGEGLDFLKTRTGIKSNPENEIILELNTELGGLPLALEKAGAYIKAKYCTFEQYMDKFTKQRQKLLNAMKIKTSQSTQKERLAVKTT